jgi:2-C-methyl-D-erythritol 4-phosphate cytidylyltransferase
VTDADAAPCSVGVVVVAAGSGSRLGAALPKAFVPVRGRPLLGYVVDTVRGLPGLAALVVVAPVGLADPSGPSWAGIELPPGAVVVAGGASRTDSVAAGLSAVGDVDVVLVHDAARCLTPLAVFERVVAAVVGGAAGAVPGIPLVDTVKTVDAAGVITGTPDRASLRAVQTPQGFAREVLVAAYSGGLEATDDAALVELGGHHVVVVDGDALAFKVTTVDDLDHAERVLAQRAAAVAGGLPD